MIGALTINVDVWKLSHLFLTHSHKTYSFYVSVLHWFTFIQQEREWRESRREVRLLRFLLLYLPVISKPLGYVPGYPSLAMTTVTAALSSNHTGMELDNFLLITACMTSYKSLFNSGRITYKNRSANSRKQFKLLHFLSLIF